MDLPAGYRVEIVFGRTEAIADELIRFWVDNGALDEPTARDRVNAVSCILRNQDDQVRGVCSIMAAALPFLGNRNVWIYRNFLPPSERSDKAFIAMFNGTRQAAQVLLDREGTEKVPTGICVLLQDPEWIRRYPLATWQETGLVYAGCSPGGAHTRIAWLDEPGGWANVIRDLEEGFRIDPVWGKVSQEQAAEIISFWLAEGAIAEEVARQRVAEVAQIARDPEGNLAGVCTLKHRHNQRLGMPLWYLRVFVSRPHRRSSLGFCLLHSTVDYMQDLYNRGEDRRAQGIFMEVENKALRQGAPQGLWAYGRFAYLGDNERGDHLRVQYFDDAEISF